jgi:hypothetical protein
MKGKEIASLLVSGLAISGGVIAAVLIGDATGTTALIVKEGLSALGGLGTEVTGSIIDSCFLNASPQGDVLKNRDLTRVVGKTIFILINDEADKEKYGSFREIIKTIGKSKDKVWEEYLEDCRKEWEKYVKENLENNSQLVDINQSIYLGLESISSSQLTKHIKTPEEETGEIEILTVEIWSIIVKGLFKSQTYQASNEVCRSLGERLHQDFPATLHQVLIEDFAQDGKAYASLQLQFLSEIAYYSRKNHTDNYEVKQKLDGFINRIDQLDALHKSEAVILNESFWQNAFNLQKEIREITFETLTRVTHIEATQEEHSEKLDDIKTGVGLLVSSIQLQSGSSLPVGIDLEKHLMRKVRNFFEEIKDSIEIFLIQEPNVHQTEFVMEGFRYRLNMIKERIQ